MGAYLALERGRPVLAVDMDPQGQLGKVFGIDTQQTRRSALELLVDSVLDGAALDDKTAPSQAGEPAHTDGSLPVVRTRLPTLDLIVANKALGLAPALEGSVADPTGRLARRLATAPELSRYDFLLLDAPPSFGPLTLNVLRAVDEVVVPVPLTFLALDGCAELARTVSTVRMRYGHARLQITMVVPTFYRRTRLAQEVLERLKERFPKEIANTVIGFHVKIDEAQSHGLSVFEYAPRDRGARALAAVAEELEARRPTADEDNP